MLRTQDLHHSLKPKTTKMQLMKKAMINIENVKQLMVTTNPYKEVLDNFLNAVFKKGQNASHQCLCLQSARQT